MLFAIVGAILWSIVGYIIIILTYKLGVMLGGDRVRDEVKDCDHPALIFFLGVCWPITVPTLFVGIFLMYFQYSGFHKKIMDWINK